MALAESCLARRCVDCKDRSKCKCLALAARLRRGGPGRGGEVQRWIGDSTGQDRTGRTRDKDVGVLVMMPGESQAVKAVG